MLQWGSYPFSFSSSPNHCYVTTWGRTPIVAILRTKTNEEINKGKTFRIFTFTVPFIEIITIIITEPLTFNLMLVPQHPDESPGRLGVAFYKHNLHIVVVAAKWQYEATIGEILVSKPPFQSITSLHGEAKKGNKISHSRPLSHTTEMGMIVPWS